MAFVGFLKQKLCRVEVLLGLPSRVGALGIFQGLDRITTVGPILGAGLDIASGCPRSGFLDVASAYTLVNARPTWVSLG